MLGSSIGRLLMLAILSTASRPRLCKEILANSVSYLDARSAQEIDRVLMSEPGFSIDQLMELAGLAVATAAMDVVEWEAQGLKKNVLVVCGPGNNGGDGLVAARHLRHFGLKPDVLYPRQNTDRLFVNLVQQCTDLGISFLPSVPDNFAAYDLVVDAIFGFSFNGPPREPFSDIIHKFSLSGSPPVLSVDIPSGWSVEQGDVYGTAFNPKAVISLTLPKLCMRGYPGLHYVGGRFIPPAITDRFQLNLPDYGLGPYQIVKLLPGSEDQLSPKNDF